ncbi:hypothetical protein [Bacillus phage SPO1L1]|nr:hypothetical protein [Bacillus phage SPO1L1]WIT26177.1 hypothetical protein [Bacillus phage SPO1L2]
MKETDLFEPVKNLLEQWGYEVYSEVLAGQGGRRADIIGYMKPASCVVELKTSLTMELIEQAYRWRNYANYVYIAIPERKKPIPSFVRSILAKEKIGIIEVLSPKYGGQIFAQRAMKASFQRNKSMEWQKVLKPEHKTWLAGGSNEGGYVTPYKLTMERIKESLYSNKEWVSLTHIVKSCETHYSNPRNGVSQALREFEYPWCESTKIGGKLHFRMKEEYRKKYMSLRRGRLKT